ncbi:prostaglandin D2 synthase b, tandem duplicate 1 [Nothobranchius furzeri]|uniref:Lipocalin-like n=3 Tax=Nothobranchius TaxID=28779 RepID=A0A1A8V9Y7_NOTFU|nr:prostaglandin D2 synthase b, tandem duplicate 1 [Nothobranchius furzeri]KAF7214037.1 lipocalin-like [Nothobranchius furzeri]
MRTTVLIVLTCVLSVCAAVTPVQDFSLEKIAGKWYLVGFATNAEWFVTQKDSMKVGTVMFVPTEQGDLHLSYATLNADGTCWRMAHLANKTETPGRFVFHSKTWNNDNDMSIVDVVYDNYALSHTIKTQEGVSDVLVKLYSRTPETTADLQQKFIQYSQTAGIQPENIIVLPKNAECPEIEATPAP